MEQDDSEIAEKPLDSEQAFENIVENAMRFLGFRLHEAEQMTLREFSYEMYVHYMREIDREEKIALQAHYNKLAVLQEERQGRMYYRYPTFDSLFDSSKRLEALKSGDIMKERVKKESKFSKDKSLHELLMNANK